jgi:hypothetical protein
MKENVGKMEKSADRFWNRKTTSLIPYVPGEQPRGEKLIKLNTTKTLTRLPGSNRSDKKV